MPSRKSRNYDKLYKICPLINQILINFKEFYAPAKEQAIDECMVKFKERIAFKQYMPQKPIKRGYKIWVRADKLGHNCDFQIYTGKVEGIVEKSLGERILRDMCKGLEGKGYHVYFDNFFTSVSLLQKLKDDRLFACGTIRSHRKGLSTLKTDKELQRGECDWSVRSVGIACIKWKDKRVVILLSTIDSPVCVEEVSHKEKDGKITKVPFPKIVKSYNANMGCVDKADMTNSFYAIDGKSRRWWLIFFWYIVDISIGNAFILFRLCNPIAKQVLKDFRRRVATGLVGSNVLKDSPGHPSTPSEPSAKKFKSVVPNEKRISEAKHLPKHGTSRRCVHCSTRKNPTEADGHVVTAR
ncbi:piggyBac transposable element-derived protein 3-like [Schistocerca americana]|uniref:piggyBac transposable element-derived protein 3-like n=1 Tax=Schistocerca americana TaxID=7009 RepID=UPI001F4FF85B|nr:piggyBac transposable element-derived protein 3-like [Schistocerca americana]